MNRYFDKIFVVNLDRRADRWSVCSEHLRSLGITAERFPAFDGNNVKEAAQKACARTHVELLKIQSDRGYKRMLVLEDDVLFNIPDDKILSDINSVEWDQLYLGGNHHGGLEPVEGTCLSKVQETYSTHAYGMHLDYTRKLLREPVCDVIDVFYASNHKSNKCYTFSPAIATQRVSFSDIENSNTDYTKFIK